MKKVPKMISSKDLDYFKDMLNWNLIACKKANHYLTHIQDEDVKNAAICVAKLHSNQFKKILDIIKGCDANGQ